MENFNHEESCSCHSHSSGYSETMSEMDFNRGVWTAAMDGDLERVESYLEKGGDPNATDTSGYTPLHYASRNGKLAICQILLSHGACPNAKTRSGNVTPLHRAAYCGHYSVVNALLQHHADPMLCDTDGQTALHKASERGHKDVIHLLAEKYPELRHVKDMRGRTALDIIPNNRSDLQNLLQ